ncbi:MAG: ROK family protein [Candidatus Omnitrophica bacterium]|nr:ROK family protein [Candidatus Omnitrophota bacterium]
MPRPKRQARRITISPAGGSVAGALSVLDNLKRRGEMEISPAAGERGGGKVPANILETLRKKGVIVLREDPARRRVVWAPEKKVFLGIGFSRKKAFLVRLSIDGTVLSEHKVGIGDQYNYRGKVKELKAVVSSIAEHKDQVPGPFEYAGVAVPSYLSEGNDRATDILGDGLAHVFNCDTFTVDEFIACAYGQRDFAERPVKGAEIIYLHKDTGNGAVLRGENIIPDQTGNGDGKAEYLRPWEQFGVVETAKQLINKGVGTDIVRLVEGDIDELSLEDVLKAAEREDELALDLVKRAGLALGVRAAYLVNIYGIGTVVLGGGTQQQEGDFVSFVRESGNRFMLESLRGELRILPGLNSDNISALGSAALCRRELFMEV